MKKILVSILAISLLAGCSFNINVGEDKNNNVDDNKQEEIKEEINYENYVVDDAEYIKTIEKKATLNNKEHDLAFVYSKVNTYINDGLVCEGFEDGECFRKINTYSVTVLFDGKIINSSLNNFSISELIKNFEIKDSDINVIKDLTSNNEYLVLTMTVNNQYSCLGGCAENQKFIYVIDENGKLIFSYEIVNDLMTLDGTFKDYDNETVELEDLFKMEDNTITAIDCEGVHTFKVENGKVTEKIEKHKSETVGTVQGWC